MFVRSLLVLSLIGAAFSAPPQTASWVTPGLDFTPGSTATFSSDITENFNPSLVLDGGLTWARETVNVTGNYTFTICGTTTIFPTANTDLWSAAYCTIWANLVCSAKKAVGFTFLNADPTCTATLSTPVKMGTYNFRVWYHDTDQGAAYAIFRITGKYCPNYGYEMQGECNSPVALTEAPIPASLDKQFYKVSAEAPANGVVYAEATFTAFPNPTAEKRKRSLFPGFDAPTTEESHAAYAPQQKLIAPSDQVEVFIQKNALPDSKDEWTGSVGSFGFNQSQTAMVSVGAPGSGDFLIEVTPSPFAFRMNFTKTTCPPNTFWAGNGSHCAAVPELTTDANTATIATGPSFFYFDVNSTMTQFLFGARPNVAMDNVTGPMVFLRKGDVPSTSVYDVAAGGSANNFIAVDSFESTGRFYISVFPMDGSEYVFWVNNLCPGNCSAQGSCNQTSHVCTCDEDYTGVFCQTEDNGGFKTEYIVLIVIGSIIVAASIIGFGVFFWNKSQQGYENIS